MDNTTKYQPLELTTQIMEMASETLMASGTSDEETTESPRNETLATFSFVCTLLIGPILCILGLVGNTLGIRLLWKDSKQQKMSIYKYLCALSLVDAVYLSIGLVRVIPHVIKLYDDELSSYVESSMNLGFIYIDMSIAHTSVDLIMIMSIERFFALKNPLKVKETFFAKYPKQIICGCLLFNLTFHLPYAVYFEVKSFEAGNKITYFIQFKDYIVQEMDIYMKLQTAVDYFIPFSVLLITNTAIPILYYRITEQRRTVFNMVNNNRQTKITLTIFLVTILFLFFCIPNMTIKVLAFVNDEYSFVGEKREIFWLFIDISNIFAFANAANDFLVYIIVSDKNRHAFKAMYCRSCCPVPSREESQSMNGIYSISTSRQTEYY